MINYDWSINIDNPAVVYNNRISIYYPYNVIIVSSWLLACIARKLSAAFICHFLPCLSVSHDVPAKLPLHPSPLWNPSHPWCRTSAGIILSSKTTPITNYYGKERTGTAPCSFKAHKVTVRWNGSTRTSIKILTSLLWLSCSHPTISCWTMWILRMWSRTRMKKR